MMSLGCVSTSSDPSSDSGTSTSSVGGTHETAPTEGNPSTTAGRSTTGGPFGESSSGSPVDTTATPGDSSSSSSGTEGASDESSTGLEPRAFIESCAAANAALLTCAEVDYTGEELDAFCVSYESELESYNAKGCVFSVGDYLACVSTLDCRAVVQAGPTAPECSIEYQTGVNECPEYFPSCGSGGSGLGGDTCFADASDCLDGNTYRVECDATVCTCLVNDLPVGMFDSLGAGTCLDDGFAGVAEIGCGFQIGTFQ